MKHTHGARGRLTIRLAGLFAALALVACSGMLSDTPPLTVPLSFYPIRPATFALLDGAVSLLYGSGPARRARGLARIVRSGLDLMRS